MVLVKMTPTQRRMYDLLSDGKWHSLVELHKCLWDEQSMLGTVSHHISLLKDKIRPNDQFIIRENRLDERQVKTTYYKLQHIDCSSS